MREKNRLHIQDLRSICDPSIFKFKTTEELEPLDEVIGQKRAVQAIDFGLNMDGDGYNIFVTGLEGTGKLTIVRDIVQKHAEELQTPDDWCMVNNFKDQFRPQPLRVPSGMAKQFLKSMNRVIKDLQIRLPEKFEDAVFQQQLTEIQDDTEEEKKQILKKLNEDADKKGLLITKTTMGYQPIAMKDGKPMDHEDYEKLPKEKKLIYETSAREISPDLELAQQEITKLNQGRNKLMEELVEQMALYVVKGRIDQIRPEYKTSKEIQRYLNQVQDHIVEEVDLFISPQEEVEEKEQARIEFLKNAFNVFKINLLKDRKITRGAPVIFEPNPTYKNLFGQIEKKSGYKPTSR